MTLISRRPLLASLLLSAAVLALGACKPSAETSAGNTASLQALPAPIAPALIPAPASLTLGEGKFVINANTPILASDETAKQVASQFNALLVKSGRKALPVETQPGKPGIRILLEPASPQASPEAYTLDIGNDGVTVRAAHAPGLFYGAISLWQLISQGEGEQVTLPGLHIVDAPRFGWRGFMLDSARHFWRVDEVKQMIDAMAIHKLNTFHWHLTDDQGWRVEIKKYPKLIEVGSCRIPSGDAGVDAASGKPRQYCGHYTQEQIRDVVRYAAERHITIVPEFDIPGHATAAIAAYPELGTTDQPLLPSSEWGVFSNLFNTEESTLTFMEDVLAEMITLFPGQYVHVGGDEAVKDQWEASARVQQRMRELGAKDEMAMQGLMVARLEKFLAAHDKRLIGWDEILEGGLPQAATVMSWRGIEGGIQAAKQGHDVVMAPSSEVYLDYLQTDSANEPPGRPATITLQQVYAYEPVPAELDETQRKHVLGLQANMWTEHSRTLARVQHNVFPRLSAVAETGWSPQAGKNFADFLQRLPAQLQRYRSLGIGYAKTPFEVAITTTDDRAAGTATISLGNRLGYEVRYTTDGSEPVSSSETFATAFTHKLPATVRAAAFFNGKPLGDASEFRIDAASLLRRTDETLSVCPDAGRLLLRLEDDGPVDGERAIFNATIFYPCWQWDQANLDGISTLQVRAGRIPYYFQLAHDEPSRKFESAKSAHGEMEIRAGGCKGELLSSAPLPAAADADGFIKLQAKLPAGTQGKQDLCILFTGDTRPQMWVLDEVNLQP